MRIYVVGFHTKLIEEALSVWHNSDKQKQQNFLRKQGKCQIRVQQFGINEMFLLI
jgi:hypothetical protein